MRSRAAAGVVAGLRDWARGCYSEEAAVELLVRSCGGRFAVDGAPWVRPGRHAGCYSLDPDSILTFLGGLSGGERRVLAVVAGLAGDRPVDDLPGILAGVDRPHLALILAALAHAGGSHEQSDLILAADGAPVFTRLPALVDWPAPSPSAGYRLAGVA